jgi:hypothetical protein
MTEHGDHVDWPSLERAIKDAAKKAAQQTGPGVSPASVDAQIRQARFDRFLTRVVAQGKQSEWLFKGGISMARGGGRGAGPDQRGRRRHRPGGRRRPDAPTVHGGQLLVHIAGQAPTEQGIRGVTDGIRHWPSIITGARLRKAAGEERASCAGEVIAMLSTSPADAVPPALLTLKDLNRAWDLG